MGYLQHTGLGASFSPSRMRVMEASSEVVRRRKAGQGEAEIFAFLSKPSGLSRISHPCANRDGNNICSSSEIAQAIASAPATAIAQDAQQAAAKAAAAKAKAGASAGLFNARNIVIAGGAVALFLYFKGKK